MHPFKILNDYIQAVLFCCVTDVIKEECMVHFNAAAGRGEAIFNYFILFRCSILYIIGHFVS